MVAKGCDLTRRNEEEKDGEQEQRVSEPIAR